MGKPLRCRLGQHEWKLTGKSYDMICKFCGKEFDDDGVFDESAGVYALDIALKIVDDKGNFI